MTPRQHCIACLEQTPARPFEAALWVDVEHDGAVNVPAVLASMDDLKREVARQLPNLPARELAQPLLRQMVVMGFAQADPCHPRPHAALLSQVLARRRGQPLGLALVALELAQRLEIPLEGVNFPGHFLLRVPGSDHVLDPCGGRRLYPKDCRELLARQFGPQMQLQAEHLMPASPREMLQRLSRNLRHLHKLNDLYMPALIDATRVLELGDASTADYLARAALYQAMECPHAERFDLERAMLLSDDPVQRLRLEQRLRALPLGHALH